MKDVIINQGKLSELEKYGFKFRDGLYQYERVIDNKLAYKVYITKNNHKLQMKTYAILEMTGNIFALVHELIEKGIATVHDR